MKKKFLFLFIFPLSLFAQKEAKLLYADTTRYVNGQISTVVSVYSDSMRIENNFALNGKIKSRTEKQKPGIIKENVFDTLSGECRSIKTAHGKYIVKHGVFEIITAAGEKTGEEVWVNNILVRVTDFTQKTWRSEHPAPETESGEIAKPVTVIGTIRDGVYFLETISELNGKAWLKNGNGKYCGPGAFVADYDAAAAVTIRNTGNGSENAEVRSQTIFLSTDVLNPNYILFEGKYSMLRFPGYACGNIINGLKEGFWTEGYPVMFHMEFQKKFKPDKDSPFYFRATGNYVAGKKTGHWKYEINNWCFEGEFVNGRQEGYWQTTLQANPADNDRLVRKYRREFEAVYEGIDVPWDKINGWYKNGQPDSTWITTSQEGVQHQYLFRRGVLLGKTFVSYAGGKPWCFMKPAGKNTIVIKAFTPDGHEISSNQHLYYDSVLAALPLVFVKSFREQIKIKEPSWYAEIKEGKPDGMFFCWYGEYGKVYLSGRFKAGKPDGYWFQTWDKDTIHSYHYKDGLQVGPSIYTDQTMQTRGTFVNGKRVGIWEIKEYHEGVNKIIEYRNDSALLRHWTSQRTAEKVENGNGTSLEWHPNRYTYNSIEYDISKRHYYTNGLCVRSVTYFRSGNTESDVYFTPLGDSVQEMYTGRAGNIRNGNGFLLDTRYPPDTFVYRNGRLTEKWLPKLARYPETRVVYLPESILQAIPGQITRTAVREHGTWFRVLDEIQLPPGSGPVNYYFNLPYGELRPAPGFPQPDSCDSLFCYTNLNPDSQGKISILYYVVRNDSEFQNLRGDLTTLFRAAAFAGPSPDKNSAAATFDGKRLRVYLSENR